MGWSSEFGSVQYEGVAKELTVNEAQQYSQLLIKKNVDNRKFLTLSDQKYFLVKPVWIRFSDNVGNPPEIHELTF